MAADFPHVTILTVPMFHPQGPTLRELAVQALSSTERGYDLLAPKFDYTPFRTPEEILVPALAHLAEPHSITAAVDLCCGTGAALRHRLPVNAHQSGVAVPRVPGVGTRRHGRRFPRGKATPSSPGAGSAFI